MTSMNLMRKVARRLKRVIQPVQPPLEPPRVPDPAATRRLLMTTGLRVDLSGRVALVTGASGQLGRAITRTLAACGASVAVHYYRSEERAKVLCDELRSAGAKTCLVHANVSSPKDADAMRDTITREIGPVDVLVMNAMDWSAKLSVLDQSLEAFDRAYDSCVRQSVIMTKTFVPAMIERKWGRVIALSSEVAMEALTNTADYTSGKRGMDGVLRVLAREVGEHEITVNQVAPGWVISDRDREAKSERNLSYESQVPLKRRGYDQDVANAIAFLASDLSAFISGVYLPVCGGRVMPAI